MCICIYVFVGMWNILMKQWWLIVQLNTVLRCETTGITNFCFQVENLKSTNTTYTLNPYSLFFIHTKAICKYTLLCFIYIYIYICIYIYIYIYMYICVYIYVCVCVYICMYIYVCVCVCVCVYMSLFFSFSFSTPFSHFIYLFIYLSILFFIFCFIPTFYCLFDNS